MLYEHTLPVDPRLLVLAVGTGAWVLWSSWTSRNRNPRHLPKPPGPKGVPFIGNALQIAHGKSWETYRDWAKQYGDIIYLDVIGQPVIVLNSIKVINDLLEEKAMNFSDRVQTPSLAMLRFEWNFGICDYGNYWRENRRVFHRYFSAGQLDKYYPVLEEQSRVFLQRLSAEPKMFMDIAKYFVGSVVTQMSYGVSDPAYTSKMIDDAEAIVQGFSELAIPGRFLVDLFPILRFVPSWFPGAGWKRKLQGYGKRSQAVYYQALEDAMERARNGIQGQYANVADDIIPKLPDPSHPSYDIEKEKARNATLIGYISGVDTTTQAVRALFLALAMYPEVQKRAQQELEQALGPCRLPKLSEVHALPYLTALVKELGRWHTVAPIGVPRCVRDDDEYNGCFIPKGSIVMCNSWAIMHDPEVFENPMEFRPERYLKDGQIDPAVLDPEGGAFGYGRRICPGRFLSKEIVTIMAASLLSVFDIRPAKDSKGDPIPLKYDTGIELVSKVEPFEVEITARSQKHAALVVDY
ncbi:O-methylsterigmatocystin oxidoreductase [Coprinopsis sp. MPI-PUGE-AT-0042]|nr:O-methylsterigmatocystin oxidoreductase [Coprinopsis sp. MPI-PUGE-AT-0042]